ncbi:uncharacterized protein LOC130152380 [Falco biarmicus]|uniref:uncharacterized protein LOC130152380 n=1 Tax=Falco biarmicus TaxID=345155 RepID=UPI0024BC7F64|nr:uncharacterized protein LOC130152380 [Falco biarmicus]
MAVEDAGKAPAAPKRAWAHSDDTKEATEAAQPGPQLPAGPGPPRSAGGLNDRRPLSFYSVACVLSAHWSAPAPPTPANAHFIGPFESGSDDACSARSSIPCSPEAAAPGRRAAATGRAESRETAAAASPKQAKGKFLGVMGAQDQGQQSATDTSVINPTVPSLPTTLCGNVLDLLPGDKEVTESAMRNSSAESSASKYLI